LSMVTADALPPSPLDERLRHQKPVTATALASAT
jgi:hypothetical protein